MMADGRRMNQLIVLKIFGSVSFLNFLKFFAHPTLNRLKRPVVKALRAV